MKYHSNNIIIYYYSKLFSVRIAFTSMICIIHRQNTECRKKKKSENSRQLVFVVLVLLINSYNPNDIQKIYIFIVFTTQKKNLGNFCKLYTRDNWFDWNETKIWGNIEKWERAKVRSVDKQQIDWTDHTLYS